MKKHKNKFIAALVVVAALAAAWFFGAMPQTNMPSSGPPPGIAATAANGQPDGAGGAAQGASPAEQPMPGASAVEPSGSAQSGANSPSAPVGIQESESADMGEADANTAEIIYADASGASSDVTDTDGTETDDIGGASFGAQEDASVTPEEAPGEEFVFDDPDVNQLPAFVEPPRPDGLYTPQVAAHERQVFAADHPNMREPVEPQNMDIGDESFTVTLSVRAHMILYNMHLLHRDKHELVPEDGWIFPPTLVTVWESESVHNVLQREMRRERIHMSSRWTPIFNSAYVEAINNLFEFDVGPLSGWMYRVNGWFPNFGASRYLLAPGDVVEWIYTVDLGRDLGVDWLAGDLG